MALVAAIRRGSTSSADDTAEDDIESATTSRHPANHARFAAVESDSKGTRRGVQKIETDLTKRCQENWEHARTDGINNLGPQYFAQADGFPVAGQPAISVHMFQEIRRHLKDCAGDALTNLNLSRFQTTVLSPGEYVLCAERNSDVDGADRNSDVDAAAASTWLIVVTGSSPPYDMRYKQVVQTYRVFRGVFVVQVPASKLNQYIAEALLLRELMHSVLTNGCKLQVICIGSMFPHKHCVQYSGEPTMPEGIEEDVPLSASEKWGGGLWFQTRLKHAYGIVANKVQQSYRQWTASKFGELAVSTAEHGCSGETLHAVLINSIGTAWLEKWIGNKDLAIQRLQDVLECWLQDHIKRTRERKTKPPKKHADLERMLRQDGGITGQEEFHVGEHIEAQWCDKFGNIDKYTCPRTWRKIVVAPGWHQGVITGVGPSDWPGTWAIKFNDGTNHYNTPTKRIRRAASEPAPTEEPARL